VARAASRRRSLSPSTGDEEAYDDGREQQDHDYDPEIFATARPPNLSRILTFGFHGRVRLLSGNPAAVAAAGTRDRALDDCLDDHRNVPCVIKRQPNHTSERAAPSADGLGLGVKAWHGRPSERKTSMLGSARLLNPSASQA
jgi:hypothetical protein